MGKASILELMEGMVASILELMEVMMASILELMEGMMASILELMEVIVASILELMEVMVDLIQGIMEAMVVSILEIMAMGDSILENRSKDEYNPTIMLIIVVSSPRNSGCSKDYNLVKLLYIHLFNSYSLIQ